MKTLQDAFDVIWTRSKIKVKSINPITNACMYRPGNDLPPCFAGVLIDDQHYEPGMEGQACDTPLVCAAITASGYPESVMYSFAQSIHDGSPMHWWESELRSLAKEYKVTPKD